MRIALVGFGKMGHMLKETALSRGHDVVLTTDPVALDADFKSDDCAKVAEKCRDLNVQGIIEFTHPSVVVSNISALVPTGIPLVVGTTGWDSSLDKVKAMVKEWGSSFLYSSNFSEKTIKHLLHISLESFSKVYLSNHEFLQYLNVIQHL